MSKSKIRNLIILGVLSLLILLVSIWYTTQFNEGRFVTPMDFSGYRFQVKDLPMIFSVLVMIGYAIHFIISLVQAGIKNQRTASPYTPTINPKWGVLGILGFLGLLGIWTFKTDRLIYPFFFFVFFGFFGFYYQGKMSNTLRDERFLENEQKAQLVAYKTGLILVFLTASSLGIGVFSHNLAWALIFLISSISIIWGLAIFLSSYLLYRYDQGEE